MLNSPRRHLPRLALAASLAAGAAFLPAAQAATGTFFFTDTPYLSTADIPAGFYLGGAPTLLENLEDNVMVGVLTPNTGFPITPGGNTDSVDADDGVIDGNGNGGRSWFGAAPIRITFSGTGDLPTAFGLVWTDGTAGEWTFSAVAADDTSLGSITRTVGDGSIRGTTAEDRFFGVQFAGGIKSITISGPGAVELDHIQFGTMAPVPEPTSAALLLAGLTLLARRRGLGGQR
ncbi:MAG: PEP-CTERM sorting domain-containing protein [Rubrivivax sp.]|jgi:hypothetical protein|nr:PEP-CTERM sorting domain-containing protein [Rubrivivax sp.]